MPRNNTEFLSLASKSFPRLRSIGFECRLFLPFLPAAVLGVFLFGSALAIPKDKDVLDAEEITMEVWQKSIGSIVVPAQIVKKTVFLQPSDIFNFIHVRANLSVDHKIITGYYINELNTYEFNFKTFEIKYKGRTTHLAKDEHIETESGNYIRSDIFERIFLLKCIFDYNNLNIQLVSEETLPAELEAQFDKEKNNMSGAEGMKDPDRRFGLKRSWLSLGALDWNAQASYSQVAKNGGYGFVLGGQLLGGDFDVSLTGSSASRPDLKSTPWEYRYSIQNTSLITGLTLGRRASFSGANVPDSMIGLQITNAFTGYRSSFTDYTISDRTEPNWDVELYINGTLVSYTKADQTGQYKFTFALPYGSTDVKLRFHGPYGEVRYQTMELRIPYTFLPPGNIEYTFTGGTSFNNPGIKNSTGTLDLKLGVSGGISLSGGVRYQRDDQGKPEYTPYGSTSLKLGSRLLLGGDYYHKSGVRGNMDFTGPWGIAATAEYDHSFSFLQPQQTLIQTGISGNTITQLAPDQFTVVEQRKLQLSMPIPFIGGNLRILGTDVPQNRDSGNTVFSTQAGLNILGFPIDLSVNYSFFRDRFRFSRGAGSGVAGISLPPFLEILTRAQFNLDFVNHRIPSGQLELTRNIGEILCHASVLTDFPPKNISGQFSAQIPLSFTRLGLSASAATGAQPSASASMAGSFGFDPLSTEFYSSDVSTVKHGGLEIVPFLDLNADGKFEPGEPLVHHLGLEQPPGRPDEESSGIIRIVNIEPYKKFTVKLSTENLDNISWVPKFQTFEFISPANGFARVEVPLAVAGQMEGYVYTTTVSRDEPLGGVRMRVRHNEENDTSEIKFPEDMLSYSTGEYFYLGLSPGKYRVFVDPKQLTALGMESIPPYKDFTMQNKEEGDVVSNLNFTLKSEPTSAPRSGAANSPMK